ncbi:hypothetical protein MSAN_01263500 [Mycena sanguinolenta]|uniref:Uncharacterized protein n=1 Tax=Mycena sanguinolenta TaxID=230812 RepID=A0A8H7D231_9AGAR|nr:hypothetical protein MSAN_01263500 [Mycena sanguinolenta]
MAASIYRTIPDGASHGKQYDGRFPLMESDVDSGLVAHDVDISASEQDTLGSYNQFDDIEEDDSQSYASIASDLHTALHKWYGFIMSTPRKTPATKPEMSVVSSLVGLQDINMDFKDVMATFFGQLLEAKTPNDIDKELLDFHQRDSALFRDWPFAIRREVLTNTLEETPSVYYVLLDHKNSLGSRVLLLQSAANVLEILRQGWGPRLKDVAKHLLSRGMAFHIAIMESSELVRKPAVRPKHHRAVDVNSGLGSRKGNFRANINDYRAYVAQRDSQLLDTSRGHIALSYGGVIGRLARTEISIEKGLCGPGADVYDVGTCLWDGKSSHAYWHETLTEHEIDLICGVYYVKTGVRKKVETGAEQTMLLSFWPKPNSWARGNLDPGWWSAECEGVVSKTALPVRGG